MLLVHDMRTSSKQTTVAVIRSELGLSIEEFGELIGKAPSTIKALEAKNRLALSEETAAAISEATGVSLAWLLDGDPRRRMVTPEGKPYTKEVYEMISGRREHLAWKLQIPEKRLKRSWDDLNDPEVLWSRGLTILALWFPVYSAAAKVGKAEIVEHLTSKFNRQMIKRFGTDGEFDVFKKLEGLDLKKLNDIERLMSLLGDTLKR